MPFNTPLSAEFKKCLDFLDTDPLRIYEQSPSRIQADFGAEENAMGSSYSFRQITELIQNGADAIAEQGELAEGKIEVVLTDKYLYVGNTGMPIAEEGLRAILTANSSPKRGCEIGRYGVGFKSLLTLEGPIHIYSKTNGNILLDPERCRDDLCTLFEVEKAPGLRLAWPLYGEKLGDNVIVSKLSKWAETLIRAEIKNKEAISGLKEELRKFEAEFLLFLEPSIIIDLHDLSDENDPYHRQLRVQKKAQNKKILHDGETESDWYVFKKIATITDPLAIKEATSVHYRETIPISWAYPASERFRTLSGYFWAFFSTNSKSHVAGILNAPWKLSLDRGEVNRGAWNEALCEEAAELIASNIKKAIRPDDPGSILDAFPRQNTDEQPAAKLVNSVWNRFIAMDIIPAADGSMQRPSNIFLPPTDNKELLSEWNQLADTTVKNSYPHFSCFSGRERVPRLKECLRRVSVETKQRDYKTWLEEIATIDFNQAKDILKFTDKCRQKMEGGYWDKVKQSLVIIPSADGELISADRAIISAENIPTTRELVAPEIAADEELRIILTSLGVKAPDDSVWLESLSKLRPTSNVGDWDSFWKNLRLAPSTVIDSFLRQHEIYVKRTDGEWVLPSEALLPGGWVIEGDQQNVQWLLDNQYHQSDSKLLSKVNVKSQYNGTITLSAANCEMSSWVKHIKIDVYDECDAPNYQFPTAAIWLKRLTGSALHNATLRYIAYISNSNSISSHVTISFDRYLCFNPRGRSSKTVINPIVFYLLEYGILSIGSDHIPFSVFASRLKCSGIKFSPNWDDIENVARLIPESWDCNCSIESYQKFWVALCTTYVNRYNVFDPRLSPLWNDAAKDDVVPDTLPAGINGTNVPLSEINVTSSKELVEDGAAFGFNVILLNAMALSKWVAKGAKDIAREVLIDKFEVGETVDIRTIIPELSRILSDESGCYPCRLASRLIKTIRDKQTEVFCLPSDSELLISKTLEQKSLRARLDKIIPDLLSMGWCSGTVTELLNQIIEQNVLDARAKIKGKESDSLAHRLSRAVGGVALRDALRDHVGESEDSEWFDEIADIDLGELALAQFGTSVLAMFKGTLEENGLKPPSIWGSEGAFSFVQELGFPVEYAKSPESKRESSEIVSGPIILKNLHGFQIDVMDGLKQLFESSNLRRRAVVSLPTGGGKTRVMVQAAVEYILKPESEHRNVVWIAQTDELCEQAVQAFRQVWVNIGAEGIDLRIYRLWGSQKDPYEPSRGIPFVVVASIQTLNNRFDALEWLAVPGLVVIDECHHAITPSYTKLLAWLDAESPRSQKNISEEPPIIGLSATPFRTNDEESERLAKRFDNTWLPEGQETLYKRLIADNVLSTIKNEALNTEIRLTDNELSLLERLEKAGLLEKPEGVTALISIDERLSKIEKRNSIIVKRIKDALTKKEAFSILLFANSVKHARKLSLLLNRQGIASAPIDGETPRSARRDFLDKFKIQQIQVLCNHSVLTTGFDAPKTDMILISRTIFSPVSYMQIVGRGLRGPKNQGTSTCLLVTITDNLDRFSEKYAYHYCEEYFNKMRDN